MKETGQGKTTVLVLGAGGMLGSSVFRFFMADTNFRTYGTLRSKDKLNFFNATEIQNLLVNVDVYSETDLLSIFSTTCPDVVVNCVGIIKQVEAARNHFTILAINTLLPHRLAQYCRVSRARLVHISTDCVFSGSMGGYVEDDFADADDLYGRSKYLGEVDYSNAITLRTSIIGHELGTAHSLVDWFLAQKGTINGYKNAIFSGLPSIEVARAIRDFVIPNTTLHGLYHLSSAPIDKFSLLNLVKEIYDHSITILPHENVVIDRSLLSNRFRNETGFRSLTWPNQISIMHQEYLDYPSGRELKALRT